MTEPHNPEPPRDEEPPLEPAVMPRWVPLLIGAVLVVIAGFAVYTGLRYREGTLVDRVQPRSEPRARSSAPPGEPDAGASRVLSAEGVPTAGAPVSGPSRAVVRGGPGGVESEVRIWARRGFVLNVLPEDAMVYVNDLLIGQVHQFNSMDEVYDFPEQGSYTIRIVTHTGASRTYVITAAEDAKLDIARISARL
jgi:hypothetical protein